MSCRCTKCTRRDHYVGFITFLSAGTVGLSAFLACLFGSKLRTGRWAVPLDQTTCVPVLMISMAKIPYNFIFVCRINLWVGPDMVQGLGGIEGLVRR